MQENESVKKNTAQELIHELPKALINWYPFAREAIVLLVCDWEKSDADLAYEEVIKNAGLSVEETCAEAVLSEDQSSKKYDYILAVGKLETSSDPAGLLCALRSRLKDQGVLLLGTDNRLGARYFCGDQDEFTGRSFDGVEDYVRINEADRDSLAGRVYSKKEIEEYLGEAGIQTYQAYSVFPALEEPQQFYAEDYLPKEAMESRADTYYSNPETIFLEEPRLYSTLIRNGLFHVMANAYLFECTADGKLSDALHVTTSVERGREDAIATIIGRDRKVRKRALYPEGIKKMDLLLDHQKELQARGIRVVEGKLENDEYVMDFVEGESVAEYLKRLAKEDYPLLIKELERFYAEILRSSEEADYDSLDWVKLHPNHKTMKPDDPNRFWWKEQYEKDPAHVGPVLKRGFIDMASINCFLVNGEFVFYDQEFVLENIPAKSILWRTIDFVYWGDLNLQNLHPKSALLERFGIDGGKDEARWFAPVMHWISGLRNWAELRSYHEKHRANGDVINSNRQRMNYSASEYERYFRDIFKGADHKKLYLFGSGNFTKKFISQFGSDYTIEGIFDNNPDKWGSELQGYPIMDPETVKSLPADSYKVIICIKNYVPVLMQIRRMGVTDYAIYDWDLSYPAQRKTAPPMTADEKDGQPKKYHVGYVAGVFDLFHIGHVNLFRRAKEQCDHLIVGVVSDEQVRNSKGTTPYMPFEDRLEIVRACRYVDEAVGIPPEYNDTAEAHRRYQFDVQFSGSDYENDPEWLAKREYLRKHGADIVFFPYTESTSSTKLKEQIRK